MIELTNIVHVIAIHYEIKLVYSY